MSHAGRRLLPAWYVIFSLIGTRRGGAGMRFGPQSVSGINRMKNGTASILACATLAAAPALAEPASGSITAHKTPQSEAVRVNFSSSAALGPGRLSGSLLLSDSPGSGIDYTSVNLSYQGAFGQTPRSAWIYQVGYELDTLVQSSTASETLSGSVGHQWANDWGFSSGVNLTYANQQNLHGQTHETKTLSFSTSKTIDGWRIGLSAEYGENDSSVAALDRFGSGSISLGRAITEKTYISFEAVQSNEHIRRFYNDAPYDIWMESRTIGFSLRHQFTPKLSSTLSVRHGSNKTEYFGDLVSDNETVWTLSKTYRF